MFISVISPIISQMRTYIYIYTHLYTAHECGLLVELEDISVESLVGGGGIAWSMKRRLKVNGASMAFQVCCIMAIPCQ